mgnify:CR=1 FL=1
MEKEFATMPITPAVDLDGLLLLLPHELMGLAIIVGMLAVAVGRNHFVSTVKNLRLFKSCTEVVWE